MLAAEALIGLDPGGVLGRVVGAEAGVDQPVAVLPGDDQQAALGEDLARDALVEPGAAQRGGRHEEVGRAGAYDVEALRR